jgi:hypothetical protein
MDGRMRKVSRSILVTLPTGYISFCKLELGNTAVQEVMHNHVLSLLILAMLSEGSRQSGDVGRAYSSDCVVSCLENA